jgi:hypothetical protein
MFKKLLLLLPLILTGCATVQQTIYLQNAEVNGPLNTPPIYITDGRSGIKVSPWLSFNSINQMAGQVNHSKVNSSGVFQVDTIYDGGQISYKESSTNIYNYNQDNVKWNLPQVRAGLDVDLPISKTVSILGSFSYNSQNLYQLVGGSFGLGFYKVTNNNAIRLNFGCSLQQYQYDASTVVVTTVDPIFGQKSTKVDFFHDINKKSNLDFFGNITYNTISTDIPINFFFSLAYFSQTLLNFSPETKNINYYPYGLTTTTTDTRGETSTTYISFSPGIYINLTTSMRVVLGVNIIKGLGDFTDTGSSLSSALLIMPLAKIDLSF